MQVSELAEDLRVEADALIALLRKMGIPVAGEDAPITDGQMAKVLAKVERERRAGHSEPAEAIRAALEEAAPTSSRRRRRRRAEMPEPEVETEAESESEAEAEDMGGAEGVETTADPDVDEDTEPVTDADERDDEGRCVATHPCVSGSECLSDYEPRAWSSPIYVDYAR